MKDMRPYYTYKMSKKQYKLYLSEVGGGCKTKADLIRYINETFGLLGTCVDVVTDDDKIVYEGE